jgi:hypothetical protein
VRVTQSQSGESFRYREGKVAVEENRHLGGLSEQGLRSVRPDGGGYSKPE